MRVSIDGPSLRKLRELQRVQLSDLARSVGMTTSGLGHIEKGRRATVSAAVFASLVQELDIIERPDWLMPPPAVNIPGPRSSTASRLSCGTPSGIIGGRTVSVTRTSAA